MDQDWALVALLTFAAAASVVAAIGGREWLRARQFKENMKAHGRRR